MRKVNRFSLEERYGYQNRKVIYDKNADNDIELNSIYPIIDLFNQFDEQIAELKKQLEEKEKDNQFLKKMYLSERAKNDNYHTEKYALDKPVEELRKIKLTPKEKEIYYKGFDNCERQFATHIAELTQQLKSQPAEIVEKIKEQLIKRLNTIAGYGRMTTDELSFFIETEFGSDLDTILKEYGGNNENRN